MYGVIRSSNSIIKRFSAPFQLRIGIVQRREACNSLRFLIDLRITLLRDYRVDAEVSLRTPHTTQRADFPHWAVQSAFTTYQLTALGRRGGSIE